MLTAVRSSIMDKISNVENDIAFSSPLTLAVLVCDSADALELAEDQMLQIETNDSLSMVMGGRVLPKHASLADVGVRADTGRLPEDNVHPIPSAYTVSSEQVTVLCKALCFLQTPQQHALPPMTSST